MLPQREELLLERQLFVGVIIRIDAAFLSHLLGDGHSLLPHWSTFFTSPGSPETPAASTLVGETSEICWLPRKASDVAINSAADTRTHLDPARDFSIQVVPSEFRNLIFDSDIAIRLDPQWFLVAAENCKVLHMEQKALCAVTCTRLLCESGSPKCWVRNS